MNTISYLLTGIIFLLASQITAAQTREYVTLRHPPSMISTPKTIRDIAFSPDKKIVATAGVSWNKVFLWDTESGEMLDQLVYHSNTYTLAYSSDGRYIAVSGLDDRFTVFDIEKSEAILTGDLIRYGSPDYDEIEQITNNIKSMLFSPDGERLVVSYVRWIFIIEIKTGKIIHKLRFGGEGYPAPSRPDNEMEFLLDGRRIIAGFAPGYKIIDTISGEVIRSEHISGKSFDMFSQDKKSYYCISYAGIKDEYELLKWDVETGELIGKVAELNLRHNYDIVSPDIQYVLHGNKYDSHARLERISDRSTALDIKGLNRNIFGQDETCKVFSPDGKTIGYGVGGDAYLIDISDLTSSVDWTLH